MEDQYKKMAEKTIDRQEIYHGKIIDVFVDTVALPMGGTAKRELVFHPGGVGIVPLTAENKIILVKQFRKPMEKVMLEIPAGKLDPGEDKDPLAAAKRELEEEIKMRAIDWQRLSGVYLSPGYANEFLHIYLARDLYAVAHPRSQDPDEWILPEAYSLAEAKQMIAEGTIQDAKTVIGIQAWEIRTLKGE
ncbi:NUDIX hydrolase [Enterococcus hirae]|nr:NUDIX hydrolase [Enterococcus hirae]